MEARNEALKRGMVALQRDIEAQSNALKQGVTVLHRDVEANMLSFQRGAEFWRRVVHLYGSYKLCQLQVAVSGQSEEEISATWQRQHERGAEMLYALCTDMKGFFLKAGQFLAKPDLSPPAWVCRLSALHDAAPADPLPLVLQTIQEELGGMGWREVWEWVEETPLGSASIAQVHRGRLRGGKEVAIKVQHAGAEPLMLTDLANLKAFAAFLQSTELNLDIMGALNELEKQIRYEFDFRREAAAMDTIRASLAGLVTKRLLVMDLINGSPIVKMEEEMRAKGLNPNGYLATRAKSMEEEMRAKGAKRSQPASVPGLVTQRLLVMDRIKGSPLVKMEEEMRAKGAKRSQPASVPGLVTQRLLVMDRIKGSPLVKMEEEMRAKGAKRSQPASVPGLRLLIMDRIKGSPIVKMEEEMRAKGVNPSSYLATRAKSDGSDQGLSACDGMEEHMRAKGVNPNSFLATRAKGVRETSCSPLYCFGDALVQGRLELSAILSPPTHPHTGAGKC
ncbi:unnamed protein product [Closterium sp. Naga37s-1]|nr:unnamed protein product [Closterium sp. Naga37s-1]